MPRSEKPILKLPRVRSPVRISRELMLTKGELHIYIITTNQLRKEVVYGLIQPILR